MRGLCARNGLLLSVLAVAAVLSGCDSRPPASASRPAPELPPVVLDTPENAARSMLFCLQAELRAAANGDSQTAEACLEQMLAMVAAEDIERALSRMPQFTAFVGDDVIEGYVHNWGSAIAYYAEGFRFDQLRRSVDTSAQVGVVVPATGPEDEALIQVTCLQRDDNTWRVSRIEFITHTAPSTPTPQPTTQPASEP